MSWLNLKMKKSLWRSLEWGGTPLNFLNVWKPTLSGNLSQMKNKAESLKQ